MTMNELFARARNYGKVNLFTADDGSYSCNIVFETIKHTELKAHSGHRCKTPEDALQKAIESAEKIVGNITDLALRVISAKPSETAIHERYYGDDTKE